MTDRTYTVTDPTPILTPCHTCGYSIPRTLNTQCPECGNIWNETCQSRQARRQSIQDQFALKLKVASIHWVVVLLVFAVGATVASGGSSPYSFLMVIFGIGFGVAASMGIGIWICKLGPSHQFKLHANLWIKQLWWLHAPWLLIAPMSIIGSAIALIYKYTELHAGEPVIMAVVLIELILWVILSFVAAVVWIDKYATARRIIGITNADTVIRLHALYAIAIWLGSAAVGFFGGMLGSLYMMTLLGSDMMNF